MTMQLMIKNTKGEDLPGLNGTPFELTFDEKWDNSQFSINYGDIEVEYEIVSRYERRKLNLS